MAYNYLTRNQATERFKQISDVCQSSRSFYDKLVYIDPQDNKAPVSLRSILMGVIQSIRKENKMYLPGATVWDMLLKAIENAPVSLGETLSEDIKEVYGLLNGYRKNPREASDDDYYKSLKTISQFIAVYSGSTVPNEILDLYKDEDARQISENDLVNPTTRVPVILCLDLSASMTMENRIDQLNEGVKLFFDSVREDSIAKRAAEICIVTFNNEAKKVVDFNYADKQEQAFENLKLEAEGNTAMGAAVALSLKLLEDRKDYYRKSGIDYWQPWLVLMTDGQATDDIQESSSHCAKLVNDGKIVLFPLAIGNGANLRQLEKFSPKRKPMRLHANKISEFFNWLSQSVRTTSQSTLGTEVKLPDISSWAVL